MRVRVRHSLAARAGVWSHRAAAPCARLFAALAAVLLLPAWGMAQSPYGGTPAAIPGGIQAENFDEGGQYAAYYDNSWGNTGGTYRWTDVDIAPTSSGGAAVGWIQAGEWLRYTVNVAQAGNYSVTTRVASDGDGGTFHIEFNGQDRTGAMRVQNTGGWWSYQDLGATVYLDAGVQEMRIVFDANGSSGSVANLSFLQFDYLGGSTDSSGSSETESFRGKTVQLPGGVQVEDFDNGRNGVAYLDHTSGNSGGEYRSTDVDITSTSGGGYAVGWTSAGEWLRYTVDVTAAGAYRVTARVASAGPGGSFHIAFNGEDKTGAINIPDTGGWWSYQDVSATLWLDAGVQTMTVVFDSNSWLTGAVGNLSFMQFDTAASAPSSGGGGGGGGGGGSGGGGGGRIRIATWNIDMGGGDPWGQAHAIVESGADVVLLQEAATFSEYMPSTYVDRLQQLTGQSWTSVWAPHGGIYSDYEGTLILTRLPVVRQSTMNSNMRGFSQVTVRVGGVDVHVFSAHLDWYDTGRRSAQLEDLLSWARQFGGPRIIGGDFNSWWGEWWISRTLQENTDTWVDVTGSVENGYTLNGSVRFDYLFRAHDQNWRLTPTACWVQWTNRSNHSLLVADYEVR